MKKITETDRVGLLLASGFTKKEIAIQTGKSINTVSKETDVLYKRTGCRNLADITRFMIARYSGLAVEDILIRATHDATLAIAAVFLAWYAMQPETLEKIATSLTNVSNFLTK
jgi:hypothetical protein